MKIRIYWNDDYQEYFFLFPENPNIWFYFSIVGTFSCVGVRYTKSMELVAEF